MKSWRMFFARVLIFTVEVLLYAYNSINLPLYLSPSFHDYVNI